METAQKSLMIPQRSSQSSARQTGERQTDFGAVELYAFHNRVRVPDARRKRARPTRSGGATAVSRYPCAHSRRRAPSSPRVLCAAHPPPHRRPSTRFGTFLSRRGTSQKRGARQAAPGARLPVRSRGFRPATGPAYGEGMGSRRAGRRRAPERKCVASGFRTHRRQKNPKFKLPRVGIPGRRLGVHARRAPHRGDRNPPRGRPAAPAALPHSPALPERLAKNGAMLPS